MQIELPDYITHYNRSEPFSTLTNLSKDEWWDATKDLDESNSWGLSRFSDLKYLEQRFDVERLLRKQFIAEGGRPVLQNPIFFFLRRNGGVEANIRNKAYRVDLKDIPEDLISFTYGDSMLSFNEDNRRLSG